ncbi:olfactory receptor 10K2-like [Dermochelys coriacea]|uniref:olfactory receptor 10K2-like n=1 Tax=Dermochelys coriacea TaxID=27794 RepID=UPI001CA81470|nr:olfactory receptor 10K2-like [Dermochelys coriacea]
MANTEWGNQTAITEFILLEFRDLPKLQTLLFLLFLVIYTATMAGNILIVALVVTDQQLHPPMYFFLGNLSCLETCYASTILPRMLASLCTALLKLSCSDTYLVELMAFIIASVDTSPPFLLSLASYSFTVATILRIPITTGKQKAFSTCSSHLIVVTIFYGTLILVYLLSKTHTLRDLNKLFSLFYTVLTPLANPLIYSLRNKEVSKALSKEVGPNMGS